MVFPEGLTTRQERALRSDPRVYAQNLLSHPDDPERNYDFKTTDGQTKLNYLLHDDGPLNPESWGNINVLKFARGCLKSTSLRIISAWALHMYLNNGLEIYMTAPREGQITNFTDDLQRNIREAGLAQAQIKDNQTYKKFEVVRQKDDGREIPVHAKFEADSGWGDGDALRGPHSHLGIIDEFQDIEKPAFDTFVQCIDRELPQTDTFPCIFIIGTPKMQSSFYHDIWQQTDQRTWDAQNRTWDQKSEPEEYIPAEDVLDDMGIEADDIDPFTVRGWHVDQMNSPLHDERAIARDKANLSPMKFANEVKAEFYSPADNLLSLEDVQNAFDPEVSFPNRRRHDESFVTVGVDWGGGADKNAADTVVMVVEWVNGDEDGTYSVTGEVLDVEFVDPTLTAAEEVRAVERKMMEYSADRAVVDYGHGYKSMEDLQDGVETMDPDGYADTVVGAKYGNISDKSSVKWETSSGQKRFFTCDKTHSIQQAVDAIKKGQITIPRGSLSFESDTSTGTKLVNHLTAPYKDLVETPSGTKKTRIQKDDTRHDDALDALTYCWLGRHQVGPMTMPSTIAGHNRMGI